MSGKPIKRESPEVIAACDILWEALKAVHAELDRAQNAAVHQKKNGPLRGFIDQLNKTRGDLGRAHALAYSNSLQSRFDVLAPVVAKADAAARAAGIIGAPPIPLGLPDESDPEAP